MLQLGHEGDKRQVKYDILVLSMIDNVVKFALKQPAIMLITYQVDIYVNDAADDSVGQTTHMRTWD